MPDIEKGKTKTTKKTSQPSQLYLDAIKVLDKAPSKEEALSKLKTELESIASKLGLTIESLLEESETSQVFKEEYFRASTIARQIAYLRK